MLVFAIMLCSSMISGEFGKIGFLENEVQCEGSQCPLLVNGQIDSFATRVEPVNPWIGPTTGYLIKFNSRLTTCMRADTKIARLLLIERATECGADGMEECVGDATDKDGYSCCEVPDTARAGAGINQAMMSFTQCTETWGGNWKQAPSGGNVFCEEDGPEIKLRPCCTGHQSKCTLRTSSDCQFNDGIYHTDKQLCSQVACLEDTCKTFTGNFVTAKEDASGKPTNEINAPDQWWRFIVPLFTHSGIIHLVVAVLPAWSFGRTIERSIGWLRIGLIYFISGVGKCMQFMQLPC